MTVGLLIIAGTALLFAAGPLWGPEVGSRIALPFGTTVHPVTLTLIVGIGLQGLAECFPKLPGSCDFEGIFRSESGLARASGEVTVAEGDVVTTYPIA